MSTPNVRRVLDEYPEWNHYEKHRNDWVTKHAGKLVTIREDEVGGFFDSDQEAVKASKERWGGQRFAMFPVGCVKQDIDLRRIKVS